MGFLVGSGVAGVGSGVAVVGLGEVSSVGGGVGCFCETSNEANNNEGILFVALALLPIFLVAFPFISDQYSLLVALMAVLKVQLLAV